MSIFFLLSGFFIFSLGSLLIEKTLMVCPPKNGPCETGEFGEEDFIEETDPVYQAGRRWLGEYWWQQHKAGALGKLSPERSQALSLSAAADWPTSLEPQEG
jgi:hypothetical protein